MQEVVKLLAKRSETPDSTTFVWSRPENFNYQAGQFIWLIIPHDHPDDRGTRRHFTLASSPTEPDLAITTKFSNPGSSFKQALRALPEGSVITIRGPHGDFVLPEDRHQPIVFLGGGIGITPFRSMIKLATDVRLPTPLTLIYANKTPADIVYHLEFDQWAAINPNFQVHYLVSQADPGWNGEPGQLSGEIINRYVPDLTKPVYYLCGPAGMIDASTKILLNTGVRPDQIRTEDFSGY